MFALVVVSLASIVHAETYTATFAVPDDRWAGGTIADGVLTLTDASTTLDLGDLASFQASAIVRVTEGGSGLSLTVGDQTWAADYTSGGAITLDTGLQGFPHGHRAWHTEEEPVLTPVDAEAGFWEGSNTLHSEVFYDDASATWFLFWTGDLREGYGYRQIGLATSPDASTWTRYAGNPVLTVDYNRETVDGIHKHMPTVTVDATGTWHMFFSCYQNDVGNRICHATSPDGFTWTTPNVDDGYVAVDRGAAEAFDGASVREPDVSIAADGTWYLFYNGTSGGQHYGPTGLSTSADGWTWEKSGAITDGESQLQGGSVVQSEWGLEQWYQCWDALCFAQADPSDWTEWTQHGDDPVLTKGWSAWNDGYIQAPTVWRADDGTYHMWFNAYSYSATGYEVLAHAHTEPSAGAWFEVLLAWDGETLAVGFNDGEPLEATLTSASGFVFSAAGGAEIEEFSVLYEPVPDEQVEDTGEPDGGDTDDPGGEDTAPEDTDSADSGVSEVPTSGEQAKDRGCGCSAAGPMGLSWILGLVAVVRRRDPLAHSRPLS